ncbi:MAG: HNH endonuclease [Bdellovibrionaceae bacterium]|nr:HNH endonuclease [Pseudobdellovibrionaceae bacterium]
MKRQATQTALRFSVHALLSVALLAVLSLTTSLAHARKTESYQPRAEDILFLGVQGLVDELRLDEQTVLPAQAEMHHQGYGSVLAAPVFDLVQYMRNNIDPRTPDEILASLPRYNRLAMFGGWVNDNPDQNCYNTRVEALIRDVEDTNSLTFVKGNPCNIAKGVWDDPYTGTTFKLASAVQIDHFIPLKHAYQSGAHAWSKERRCHYTNYMGNNFHLLTVSGHENMSKGGNSPTEYLPPNETYVCQYLSQWMKVKAIWNLTYTADEKQKIETELSLRECPRELGTMSAVDIHDQRAASIEISDGCR